MPHSPATRGLRPAVRRDLIAAARDHRGRIYCGPAGSGTGLRVRWNIARGLEEAGMAVLDDCDAKQRVWSWRLTDAGHAAAQAELALAEQSAAA